MGNSKMLCRFSSGNVVFFPLSFDHIKFCWALHWLSAEFDTPGFCSGDALFLPLADKLALCLRNVRQQLQYDIGNQGNNS